MGSATFIEPLPIFYDDVEKAEAEQLRLLGEVRQRAELANSAALAAADACLALIEAHAAIEDLDRIVPQFKSMMERYGDLLGERCAIEQHAAAVSLDALAIANALVDFTARFDQLTVDAEALAAEAIAARHAADRAPEVTAPSDPRSVLRVVE